MRLLNVLVYGSSFSFLTYGALLLTSSSMRSDFKRFGLENFRKTTGVLEVLGGLGLWVGLKWPLALSAASGGLFLLMVGGCGVRIKVRDGFLRTLPAFVLMLVNLYILLTSLK